MNIVYNASAGTGKTYQVTQLYEKLVLEVGVDPRKILLMTFTENAAEELRERVTQRLLKARRAAEKNHAEEAAETAMQALNHLPSACIGTIHSFCTRLLREHALDAGLSPGFAIYPEEERKQMLDRICRDELLLHLESDSDFKDFCSGVQPIGSGQGFGSSLTEAVPKLINEAGSLGISLDHAESMLPEPGHAASKQAFESIAQRIRELPRITPAVQTALDVLEQAIRESADVEQLVKHLDAGGLKKFGRGEVNAISHDLWNLKESVEDAVRYRERYPSAKAFARYLQSVAVAFRKHKHDINAVDFDDLQNMALRLLQSGKAKPEFSHIIVDEVQDTSRIQFELMQSLWTDGNHLVICGDKKQSIYTWRGADPQVMPDLENAILKTTENRLENLQTSYRSKAPIIEVINTLFSTVYGPAVYAEGDQLVPNPAFATEEEKPCVEFLLPDEDEELSKRDKVEEEMQAVARRINLLVNGTEEWRPSYRYTDGFHPTSKDNAYRYADILILLRRKTNQSVLESALRHYGIPYTLGGKGSGLFSRQETRDVSLFLNAITNPDNLYSLIGFLRSPWMGWSDEQIAELALNKTGFSKEKLSGQSIEILERYRALLGTRLASELVRMLIEETGYDAVLAGLPRGTQRLSNLRKIIDWLRETERGARTTPTDAARRLAEYIAQPPPVPEAALLDPAQNAVTIMTVHGAKGLTKRVVFLPDTSAREQPDTDLGHIFFNEQHQPELGLKITGPDKTSVESPGFKNVKNRAKTIREQEQKNLFYVAMTRARDLVVTSASIGHRPEGWYRHLEPLIGTIIQPVAYSELAKADEMAAKPRRDLPTVESLATALRNLPAPPTEPVLRRIPATRLAKELDPVSSTADFPDATSPKHAAALGSLGHAVLEQLALNRWQGSVSSWLEKLHPEYGLDYAEAAALEARVERTRTLMQKQTESLPEIRPEIPFVLREENRLIDGTIDLLCGTKNSFTIFDYKFTGMSDNDVLDQYCGQMRIYQEAALKFYPEARNSAVVLVVITPADTRLVPIEL